MSQRIRIKLKSYDHNLVDKSAEKIVKTVKALGVQRFEMKYSSGTLPHEHMMRSIELYGTKVMPMVRDMLASDRAAA